MWRMDISGSTRSRSSKRPGNEKEDTERWKSKQNGTNTFTAINSRAVPVIRYKVGAVDWSKDEVNR